MLSSYFDTRIEQTGITGAMWQFYNVNMRDILTIKQKFSLSEIIARIISARNIEIGEIGNFLHPTLKESIPNPFHLLDMDKAILRIEKAIYNNEKIVVFGDYDVDGATSSALIKKYFDGIGINITIYIPDRIDEGYGPNTKALLKLKEQGNSLCITVDCGTIAHEPIAIAKRAGLDIIVIDHHLGVDKLPEAVAVINPNRLDETSDYTKLAAVGVSFLMLIALNKTLRERAFFTNDKKEPNLMHLLDLVALGTVCDVMELVGLNRVFVSQGLKVMSMRRNTGLRVLSDLIGLDEEPNTYQLGFNIGPHINAGGRVGNSSLGARLLSTDDLQVANNISMTLQNLNMERKELENQGLEEATVQAEQSIREDKKFIMVLGDWHPGIIGIVAGRLKDKYNLPTIVISMDQGIGKASARSIPDVDLGSAVLSAKLLNLIVEGGGHAMAAGFSVQENKINDLSQFFSERFKDIKRKKIIKVDGVITVKGINLDLWQEIQLLQPFGVGNPEPRFIVSEFKVRKPEIIGVNHIKCLLCSDRSIVKAISFRTADTELGKALLESRVHTVLGKININHWRGHKSVQFLIEDAQY